MGFVYKFHVNADELYLSGIANGYMLCRCYVKMKQNDTMLITSQVRDLNLKVKLESNSQMSP